MQRFDDPEGALSVAPGETFALALPANPSTGYAWRLDLDPAYLERLDDHFEPGGRALGAGGQQVFRLRARAAGSTQLLAEYRRPWGGEPAESRRVPISIA